jgi:nucleoside 2-deoxyribosyltransferase
MRTVYLAGPITGLTYDNAQDWREKVAGVLWNHGVMSRSPLRGKQYLRPLGDLDNGDPIISSYANNSEWPLSSPKGITLRDRNDVKTSDVVLANLLGADKVSIGTVLEIAWADAFGTPSVVIMEKDNPHQHSMIQEASGIVVESLDLAVRVTLTICGVDILGAVDV